MNVKTPKSSGMNVLFQDYSAILALDIHVTYFNRSLHHLHASFSIPPSGLLVVLSLMEFVPVVFSFLSSF